jgi:hypothetical protein
MSIRLLILLSNIVEKTRQIMKSLLLILAFLFCRVNSFGQIFVPSKLTASADLPKQNGLRTAAFVTGIPGVILLSTGLFMSVDQITGGNFDHKKVNTARALLIGGSILCAATITLSIIAHSNKGSFRTLSLSISPNPSAPVCLTLK